MAKSKLSPADNKFVAKFLKPDFDNTGVITRSNRFTGESVEVDPICAAAIDFVNRIEPILYDESALKRVNSELKVSNSRMNFDRARYIVAKLNTTAYSKILD